jgi:hypothetical protein
MDQRWSRRLLLWWERTEHSLKRRWWLWPLLYLIEDFWHMVHASTSEYLRDHGAAVIADLLAHVPSDPMTLAVITGVLIIVSLAIHAYFDSRKASATATLVPGKESGQSLPSGAESRDQFELLEQVSKRDRDIHDLNRTLGNRVAEIENTKDAHANLEAAVERLWKLKEDAREIRRLWPDADFNKRPAFRTSWIPSAGTDEPWLEKALAWHQAMFVAPIYPALSHHHLTRLTSMSLWNISTTPSASSERRRSEPCRSTMAKRLLSGS